MEITVQGMSCEHCKAKVIKTLKSLKLKKVEVDLETGKVSFKEHKKVSLDDIKEAISSVGYSVVE